MQVKFETIEKLQRLLTTDDWLNKYDQNKRLEKLRLELEKEKNSKKKERLEKSIKNIEANLQKSGGTAANNLTLQKLQISDNDAQVLLAIYIYYMTVSITKGVLMRSSGY